MYNYRSATNPDTRPKAEAQILEEIKEGHYVVSPDRLTLTSAIGAIPKKNSESVRLIHDCSQPSGTAVNDYAPLGPKLQYQSVDDAVKLMRPHGYSAKIDLRSAYRSVKIHPSNYEFTGLSWQFEGHDEPTFLYDTRLPFGSKLSPGIFHRLTQAVRRMMARRNYEIVAYLDDFFIHAATQAECAAIQRTLVSLLRVLGFAISWNKIEGPSKRITFLGIAIDSESFTIELPEGKLVEFYAMLQQFAGKKRATLRQLQQLAGRLNWACQVVRGGRSYLRRILDLMKPLKRPHHQARFSHEFQADVSCCQVVTVLSFFNGKCIALNCAPVHDIYLDASNLGAGYVFASDWGYTDWKVDLPAACDLHINNKEIFSAVLATRRWAPLWANSRVIFHTDNITARAALSKGTAKSQVIMPFLRELFWWSAIYNFTIDACFIPGRLNDTPDTISRLRQTGYIPSLLNLMGLPVTVLKFVYLYFLFICLTRLCLVCSHRYTET